MIQMNAAIKTELLEYCFTILSLQVPGGQQTIQAPDNLDMLPKAKHQMPIYRQ